MDEDNKVILVKLGETGGFGATIWRNVEDLPLTFKEKSLSLAKKFDPIPITYREDGSLTGIWKSTNVEKIYYVNHIKKDRVTWACGIGKDNETVSVLRGEIGDDDLLCVKWADVYKRDTTSPMANGEMHLRINKSGNEVVSFRDDTSIENTFFRIE